MVTKKTYYKNITHIPGQIVVNLPNGSRRTFKSSTEAQAFFDKNYGDKYSMEIISTQDNKGEITINGGELPEVVVTGKAPAKKPEDDNSRPAFHPSERRGVDKYNILMEVINNPGRMFEQVSNFGDYSPFSWSENALRGQNARRFFTEPAINTRVGGLNSYGATLDNSLKQMLNVSPTYSTDPATGVRTLVSPSPSFDLTPDRIKLVNMWLQQNAPNLYGMPYNQSTVPFPVTTIRKKGGKLVKKKFNLNGKKKTCK